MAIQEKNWDVIQGDAWDQYITISDANGPINLTGYTFIAEVRDKDGGETICATLTLGNGIVVVSTGVIYFKFSGAQTKNFTFPKARYQIQAIDGSLNPRTLEIGWLNVKAGVIA